MPTLQLQLNEIGLFGIGTQEVIPVGGPRNVSHEI